MRARALDPGDATVGLDIGGSGMRAAVAVGGRLVRTERAPLGRAKTADRELDQISGWIDAVVARSAVARASLSRIGVACGAVCDEAGAVISWPNRPAWLGVPLQLALESCFEAPVLVEGDARAGAFGEWVHSRGRRPADLAYVSVGTGIGCGLILGGELYRGHTGLAGELGHTTVSVSDRMCRCGKRGCLQATASAQAVVDRWLDSRDNHPARPAGPATVARAARRGDPMARRILDDAAAQLGRSIGNLVNVLGIESVVVGGGMLGAGDRFLRAVRQAAEAEVANIPGRPLFLDAAALGAEGCALGALALAMEDRHASAIPDGRLAATVTA
jgi:predicted NBD/HSP70 family sugar kinase